MVSPSTGSAGACCFAELQPSDHRGALRTEDMLSSQTKTPLCGVAILLRQDTILQRHHRAKTPFGTAAGTAGRPGEDIRVHWPLYAFLFHKKLSPSYDRRRALGTGLR